MSLLAKVALIALLWAGALIEPTPIGEAAATVATVAILSADDPDEAADAAASAAGGGA